MAKKKKLIKIPGWWFFNKTPEEKQEYQRCHCGKIGFTVMTAYMVCTEHMNMKGDPNDEDIKKIHLRLSMSWSMRLQITMNQIGLRRRLRM